MSSFARTVASMSIAALALLPACSVHHDSADASFDTTISHFAEGGLDAPRDSPDTGPLTDAEIVGVLDAIHQGDILVDQFMSANTVRADVRAFADDLTAQHEVAEASLLSAASAAGLISADSSIRQRQASLRAQELDALRAESCTTRDERYLGLQRIFSGEALGIIDSNLLPAVTNAAIRAEIETTRAILETQLTGLPLPDGASPEAATPNWEAGVPADANCPSMDFDAYYDVGIDS